MESQAATTVTKEIWMSYVAYFRLCFYFSSFASFFSFLLLVYISRPPLGSLASFLLFLKRGYPYCIKGVGGIIKRDKRNMMFYCISGLLSRAGFLARHIYELYDFMNERYHFIDIYA